MHESPCRTWRGDNQPLYQSAPDSSLECMGLQPRATQGCSLGCIRLHPPWRTWKPATGPAARAAPSPDSSSATSSSERSRGAGRMRRAVYWVVHQNAPRAAKGAGTAAAVASDSRCSCGRLNTSCGGGGRALCAPSSHAGTRASNQQRSPGWLLPLSPHCFGSTSPRARGVRKARPVRSAAVHALRASKPYSEYSHHRSGQPYSKSSPSPRLERARHHREEAGEVHLLRGR